MATLSRFARLAIRISPFLLILAGLAGNQFLPVSDGVHTAITAVLLLLTAGFVLFFAFRYSRGTRGSLSERIQLYKSVGERGWDKRHGSGGPPS